MAMQKVNISKEMASIAPVLLDALIETMGIDGEKEKNSESLENIFSSIVVSRAYEILSKTWGKELEFNGSQFGEHYVQLVFEAACKKMNGGGHNTKLADRARDVMLSGPGVFGAMSDIFDKNLEDIDE